jgi:hypothetical protein
VFYLRLKNPVPDPVQLLFAERLDVLLLDLVVQVGHVASNVLLHRSFHHICIPRSCSDNIPGFHLQVHKMRYFCSYGINQERMGITARVENVAENVFLMKAS